MRIHLTIKLWWMRIDYPEETAKIIHGDSPSQPSRVDLPNSFKGRVQFLIKEGTYRRKFWRIQPSRDH